MGETVRWKLVKAEDGEFTTLDILFLWAMLHVFAAESGFPVCSEAIRKLQAIMDDVYAML
jgi:hypothetical protein